MRGRRTDRGELITSWTCAYWPSNVKGLPSCSVIRVTISKCSASIASRSFSGGNGYPNWSASTGLNPVPRPSTSRPSDTASSVDAILAVRAGLRNVVLTMQNPISTRGTTAATAVASVKQSKAIDSPPHFDVTCSPNQTESKPRCSASWQISITRRTARPGSQPSNSLK